MTQKALISQQALSVFEKLHQTVLDTFSSLEGATSYTRDKWQHPAGGGGTTCILENGHHIEKSSVSISYIEGQTLPSSSVSHARFGQYDAYRVMGISTIIHPRNPHVPTSHMNVRLFLLYKGNDVIQWWFGGGYDLTPYIIYEEDIVAWHYDAKQILDQYGDGRYQDYKRQCDRYFYLPHRQETRGVGGIFYDQVNDMDFETGLAMTKKVATGYANSYSRIFKKRMHITSTKAQEAFMRHRRTRYAEFNLLYDRGTKFGLQSQGRIASILASMPPSTGWLYHLPCDLEDMDKKLSPYLKPREWVLELENSTT